MMEFIAKVGQIGVLIFIVSSMLSMGLAHSLREIIKPLRNVRGVLAILIANFVILPAFALVLLHFASFEMSAKIGLFLFASSAGAAFVIKYVEIAGGDLALTVSLLLVLMPATVIFLPIAVPMLLPEVAVGAGAIARPLIWSLIVPLGVGLLVETVWPRVAETLQPWISRLSTVALAVLVVALLISNFSSIVGLLGTGVLLVALLITLGGFGVGYLIGGSQSETRTVVAFGTAQKNIAAVMVVATQSLRDEFALIVIIAASLMGMVVLLTIAFGLRRREAARRDSGEKPRPLTYREV